MLNDAGDGGRSRFVIAMLEERLKTLKSKKMEYNK